MILKKNNLEIEITPEELASLNAQAKGSVLPKEDELCYLVGSYGQIVTTHFQSVYEAHVNWFYLGNCFKTEAEAIHYQTYLEALKTINKFKLENGLVWKADWKVENEEKYYIFISDKKVCASLTECELFSVIGYFQSREDAQKVIDNCKDAILTVAEWGR